MSTKPDAWTLSPQLTAAPELWRGCVIACPFWEASGTPRNILNPKVVGTVGSPSIQLGGSGREVSFDDASYYEHGYTFPEVGLGNWNEITIASRFINPISFSEKDALIGDRNLSSNNGWVVGVMEGSGNDGRLYVTFSGVARYDTSTRVPGIRATKKSIVWRAVNGVSFDSFVEGELFESINIGTLKPSGLSQNVLIGALNDSGSGSRESQGLHEYLFVWNRALTDNEIKALHEDPFAMLRPAGF